MKLSVSAGMPHEYGLKHTLFHDGGGQVAQITHHLSWLFRIYLEAIDGNHAPDRGTATRRQLVNIVEIMAHLNGDGEPAFLRHDPTPHPRV